MKKCLLAILLCWALSAFTILRADKANPVPYEFRQPDGSSITLRVHGDEFCSWYTSEDGKTLYQRGADGWWRPGGQGPTAARRSRAKELRGQRDRLLRQRRSARGKRSVGWGSDHYLVLMVEWSDVFFQEDSPDYIRRSLTQAGFNDDGAVGSARDYYIDASNGQFTPVFDVYGPVRIDRGHTEWPEGDESEEHYGMAETMIMEAAALLDGTVDFSQYDIDGDGFVENVYLFFPGQGQSSGGGPDTIWPHAGDLSSDLAFDGVRLRSYACSNELRRPSGNTPVVHNGIGTFCHEFGHVVGLPDLYDTDYEENGYALNPGRWNLMAGGSHSADGRIPPRMSTMERYLLGYITQMEDISAYGQKELRSITQDGFYCIPTSNPGEFFIPEVRDGSTFDSPLPAGLIIYHIDRSQNMVHGYTAAQRWDWWNLINGYADHPCDFLEIPDKTLVIYGSYPVTDAAYATSSFQNLMVFPYGNDFGCEYTVTDYTLQNWDKTTPYRLQDIRYNYNNNTASFNLIPGPRSLSGKVTNSENGQPVAGALILVSPVQGSASTAVRPMAMSRTAAQASAKYEAYADEDGTYKITLEESDPETLDVSVHAEGYISMAERIGQGLSPRRDFAMTPVIGGNNQYWITKASYPLEQVGYWGYSETGRHYTVAQHYTEEELKPYVGCTLKEIGFCSRATGETLWVFVDFGKTTRALFREVTAPVESTLYRNDVTNHVDVSDAGLVIPAGTDMYIGYAIRNANANYVIWTDYGVPQQPGGTVMYAGLTGADAGGNYWFNPAEAWDCPDLSNALIAFTLADPYSVNENAKLEDFGLSYISLPEGKLMAGGQLELKLVTPRTRVISALQWTYDGHLCQEGAVQLTGGIHTLKAEVTFTDGTADSIETRITVE